MKRAMCESSESDVKRDAKVCNVTLHCVLEEKGPRCHTVEQIVSMWSFYVCEEENSPSFIPIP